MKRKLVMMAITAGVLSMAAKVAEAEDRAQFVAYKDRAGEVIALSGEEKQPFLFNGNPLRPTEKYADLYKKYKKSITRFSSVRDCLEDEVQEEDQPDLTRIDWSKIDWNEDAEVCLFRIASSYKTMEDMRNWFEVGGFNKPRIFNTDNRSWLVGAGWDVKEHGVLFSPNFLLRQWQNLIFYGMSFAVRYDQNHAVYDTGVGQSVE